jgi:hypothetical protein
VKEQRQADSAADGDTQDHEKLPEQPHQPVVVTE